MCIVLNQHGFNVNGEIVMMCDSEMRSVLHAKYVVVIQSTQFIIKLLLFVYFSSKSLLDLFIHHPNPPPPSPSPPLPFCLSLLFFFNIILHFIVCVMLSWNKWNANKYVGVNTFIYSFFLSVIYLSHLPSIYLSYRFSHIQSTDQWMSNQHIWRSSLHRILLIDYQFIAEFLSI